MGQLPVFIDHVPEYEARGEFMFVRWRGLEIAVPISVCERAMAGCTRELERWHKERCAVLQFPNH